MLYTSASIFSSSPAIMGFKSKTGELFTLRDLLTNQQAYEALCAEMTAGKPELNIKFFDNGPSGLYVVELNVTGAVGASLQMDSPLAVSNADLIPDTDVRELTRSWTEMLDEINSENAGKFEGICFVVAENAGILDKDAGKFVNKPDPIPSPVPPVAQPSGIVFYQEAGPKKWTSSHRRRISGVTPMIAPTDTLTFIVPTIDDLISVYGDPRKSAQDQDRDSIEEEDEATPEITGPESRSSLFGGNNDDVSAIVSEQGVYTTFDDIFNFIDTDHIHVETVFPYYDSVAFRDCIMLLGSGIDPKLIAGDPAKTSAQIYPNEKQFFEDLCDLYQECLAYEYDTLDVQDLIAKCAHSKLMDQFLEDMIREAINLNWAHTGQASSSAYSGTDDAEDSENVEVDVPGYYTIGQEGDRYVRIPLDELLRARKNSDDLHDISFDIAKYCKEYVSNSYSMIFAAIQLLRFGERKPASVAVPEWNDQGHVNLYYDMQAFKITTFSGSVEDLTPVKGANGEDWVFEGFGTIKPSIEALTSARNLGFETLKSDTAYPWCIVGSREYQETKAIKSYTVWDIFSFISGIKSGDIKISGVAFDTNSDLIQITDQSLNGNVSFITADDLMKLSTSEGIDFSEQISADITRYMITLEMVTGTREKASITRVFKLIANQTPEDLLRDAQEFDASADKAEFVKTHAGFSTLSYVASRYVYSVYGAWASMDIDKDTYEEIFKAFSKAIAVKATHKNPFEVEVASATQVLAYPNPSSPEFYLGHRRVKTAAGEIKNRFCLWLPDEHEVPQGMTVAPLALTHFNKHVYQKYVETFKAAKALNKPEMLAGFFKDYCLVPNKDTWNRLVGILKQAIAK